MKRLATLMLVSGVLSGCMAPNKGPVYAQTYRVLIPGYVMDFTIPPGWQLGYGGIRHQIDFDNPKTDDFISVVYKDFLEKMVGGFYFGVVGNFRDWSKTINIGIVQFPHPLRSADELAAYLAPSLNTPDILASGERFIRFATPRVAMVGERRIVVIPSRNLDIRDVRLAEGGSTTYRPTWIALVLVDETTAVSIYVRNWSQKGTTAEAFGQSRGIIDDVVSKVSFEPLTRSGDQKHNRLALPTPVDNPRD